MFSYGKQISLVMSVLGMSAISMGAYAHSSNLLMAVSGNQTLITKSGVWESTIDRMTLLPGHQATPGTQIGKGVHRYSAQRDNSSEMEYKTVPVPGKLSNSPLAPNYHGRFTRLI